MFNKTQLKQRGWTPALIRDLLDPPDRVLTHRYPNPKRSPSAPAFREGTEHLYLKVRVLEVEKRPEFLRGAHLYRTARPDHNPDTSTDTAQSAGLATLEE